jgi:two-component system, OmpR family, phosphate regulon sensor histidine kinase PhoR
LNNMVSKKNIVNTYPAYIFIAVVALLAYFWQRSDSFNRMYLDQCERELTTKTELLAPEVIRLMQRQNKLKLEDYCRSFFTRTKTRITIINQAGSVLVDSCFPAGKMSNHRDREEITEAFKGHTFKKRRYSVTLRKEMIYVAAPIQVNGSKYVLRTADSVDSIMLLHNIVRRDMLLTALAAAAIIGIISIFTMRYVTQPIGRMIDSAKTIASGQLDIRIPEPQHGIVRDLAVAVNSMAEQLKTQLEVVTNQKNEREAIFSSMRDAIIAIDGMNHITAFNSAAQTMLGLPDNSKGRPLCEVVRKAFLIEFADKLLSEPQSEVEEFSELNQDGAKVYFLVKGTPLYGRHESGLGALLVVSDITEQHNAESFRRDFVANVSHEIRTPLTALASAAENLTSDIAQDPERSARLMNIIDRNSTRLKLLVDDVLSLAVIENLRSAKVIKQDNIPVVDVIKVAALVCAPKAESKNITITFDANCNYCVAGDSNLLEQVFINLIDNAIKYSNENSSVKIGFESRPGVSLINVKDQGFGIAAEHLPRLFERFYRVDKARSRQLGGTGLGLAIVKHIVKLHKGTVSVTSTEGQGSVFTVSLPGIKDCECEK